MLLERAKRNSVNCWKPLTGKLRAISSQGIWRHVQGSTTRDSNLMARDGIGDSKVSEEISTSAELLFARQDEEIVYSSVRAEVSQIKSWLSVCNCWSFLSFLIQVTSNIARALELVTLKEIGAMQRKLCMKNSVNCWKLLTRKTRTISSQALERSKEGSTTRKSMLTARDGLVGNKLSVEISTSAELPATNWDDDIVWTCKKLQGGDKEPLQARKCLIYRRNLFALSFINVLESLGSNI